MPDLTLPIAEIFTSVHGEGFWVGTPMTFIRLAGCTVGRTFHNDGPDPVDFPIFPDGKYMFQCTTFDGRTFPCDTDYRKTQDLALVDILKQIPFRIRHVCITGGEPLMHWKKITELGLLNALIFRDITVHFETSGTIIPEIDSDQKEHTYFACSPKANYLPQFLQHYADEVRIMVDHDLDVRKTSVLMGDVPQGIQIFLCPLSSPTDVTEFDPDSLQRCLTLLEIFPNCRVSIQQHKVLHVR